MKSDREQPEGVAERREIRVAWFWPVLGLAVCLSFPYCFSLQTFYSHDDFAIIWFHRDVPLWQVGRFFSPEVLTADYRPLQSYLFAVFWRASGPVVFPFCLTMLILHILNILLFGRLVNRMFGSLPLTLLSVIFFAANWEYCEVVFWKGNCATILSWLFTLGTANLFAEYLKTKRWRAYAGAVLAFLGALLSKESTVNVPLLLSLIYVVMADWRWGTSAGSKRPLAVLRDRAAEFGCLLVPFFLLTFAYVVFHQKAIVDMYDWLPKGYRLENPFRSFDSLFAPLRATQDAMSIWLTSPLIAGLDALAPAKLQAKTIIWLDRHPYVLPLALIGVATALSERRRAAGLVVAGLAVLLALASQFLDRPGPLEAGDNVRQSMRNYGGPVMLIAAVLLLRNRRVIFGLFWAVLAFFPASLLPEPDYESLRYYYGPLMGVAVVLSDLLVTADRAVRRRGRIAEVAALRGTAALLVLVFVFANVFFTTTLVTQDARYCGEIEDLYYELARRRGRVRPKTLFEVHCLNAAEHFHEGMGLREMFKIALDDDTVEAILPGQQSLSRTAIERLVNEYPAPIGIFREPNRVYRFRFPPETGSTTATVQAGSPGPR